MSRTLTAADHSALIRLASELPVGSEERRAILAGLYEPSVVEEVNVPGKHFLHNNQAGDRARVYGNAHMDGRRGSVHILGGNWDGSEGKIVGPSAWLAPGVPAKGNFPK